MNDTRKDLCKSTVLGFLLLTWFNFDTSLGKYYNVWYEFTYQFGNFNGAKIWEWTRNFMSHLTGNMDTNPWWD